MKLLSSTLTPKTATQYIASLTSRYYIQALRLDKVLTKIYRTTLGYPSASFDNIEVGFFDLKPKENNFIADL